MAVVQRTIAATQQKVGGRRLQLVPILLIAAAAVVVIGLLRIVQTSQATTASFAMQSLQQEKLELETSVRQLEAEVASLSSLERIERDAERLGLTQPEQVSHVQVNVAWPSEAGDLLPERFAPDGEEDAAAPAAAAEDGSSDGSGWWQDLLGLLPFD